MIHKLLFRIWDPQADQFVSSGAQFNNTTMRYIGSLRKDTLQNGSRMHRLMGFLRRRV